MGETLNTEGIIPEFLHTLYKTICINRHFLNKVFFFFFHSLFGNLFCFYSRWHSRAMILKSRRAGRLPTRKAKCILALEVQLGGQSFAGAEDAYRGRGAGGTVGRMQPRKHGLRWFFGKDVIEGNVFMKTSLFLLLVSRLRESSLRLLHWLCLSLICSWKELVSFSKSGLGHALSTGAAGS